MWGFAVPWLGFRQLATCSLRGASFPLKSMIDTQFTFYTITCSKGAIQWFLYSIFSIHRVVQPSPQSISKHFLFLELILERERERECVCMWEREPLICCSIYFCVHWLILVSAVTSDWTYNLCVFGWCRNPWAASPQPVEALLSSTSCPPSSRTTPHQKGWGPLF